MPFPTRPIVLAVAVAVLLGVVVACQLPYTCGDCMSVAPDPTLPMADVEAGALVMQDATTIPIGDARLGGACVWSKRIGGPGVQYASGIAVGPAGELVVASSFQQSIDFGGGVLTSAEGYDVAIAYLDRNGSHVSSYVYGGPGDQFVNTVAFNGAGFLYAAGSFSGTFDLREAGAYEAGTDGPDAYLLRIRPFDKAITLLPIGGSGTQVALAVFADPSFGATVAGANAGTLTAFGQTSTTAGSYDGFVARVQSASDWAVVEKASAGSVAIVRAVTYDSSGNVVVVGSFSGTMSLGEKSCTAVGGNDAFVARFSATGTSSGLFCFGNANDQLPLGIAADHAGGVAVVGQFAGSMTVGASVLTSHGASDAFLVLLDGSLAPVLATSFGGGGSDIGTVVTFTDDGIVVGGTSFGDVDFGGGVLAATDAADAYLVKVDGHGKHMWSKRFGGPGDQRLPPMGLAKTNAGDLVAFGQFEGTIDLGCGLLTSAGELDTWLAVIRP